MGIKKINARLPTGTSFMADNQLDADELDDKIPTLEGGNFDSGHMASGYTLPAVQSSALSNPTTGDMRVDTGTSPPSIRVYDGSNESAPQGDFATAQPSTTVAGSRWYDATHGVWRTYGTKNGISGWHPDAPYLLMKNISGGDMTAGEVAFLSGAAQSFTNSGFYGGLPAISGVVPITNVIGVLKEDIASNDVGLVVPNIAGLVADIKVFNTPTLAAGDLVQARLDSSPVTIGPWYVYSTATSTGISVAHAQHGLPMGAFAKAISTVDATTLLASCEMLGQVGSGRYVAIRSSGPTSIATKADLTFDAAEHDLAIPTTDFQSSKHVPYAVRVQIDYEQVTGAAGDITLTFLEPSDASTVGNVVTTIQLSDPSAAAGQIQQHVIIDLPTNTGSGDSGESGPIGHGLFITYEGDTGTPSTDFTTLNLRLLGYWI